ncbi:MAG: DUF2974 domain-containing protein [Oscillospiraceae bacterium]|nr:DUF2974 domain-containing protein [Oscillospiraceae bacterium]
MDSLKDYILWMGDFPVSATGFRDADALVLCLLSYFDLSPVFGGGVQEARVCDCRRMIDEGNVQVEITGKDDGYVELLKAAAASRRFGDLIMTNYVDILCDDPPLQFSAVTFHNDKDLSFIAYRGTDNSLAGWREDCMISFTLSKAQEMAAEYADRHISPGRKWFMGGHSKGGNEVLYAACMLSDEKLACVERIYCLDGPGLCDEVMNISRMQRIDSKTTRIIPEFSVIGKLFEPKVTDTRIVHSSESGMMQHGLISWEIDHGRLAAAEDNASASKWINEVVDKWIGNISMEERVHFVDELFTVLGTGGARTLDELTDDGLEDIEKLAPQLKNLSETTRHILSDLAKQAFASSFLPFFRRKEKADHSAEHPNEEKK